MKVSWLAIELCLITCLYVTKHHLFTQNSNLISRSINITRSLHVKRTTLNIITWLPSRAIKSPPPGQANRSIILKFAHLKFQRFLRPLPPLYMTKHPLILFLPNFASYFHIKTLIKTKLIRWTQFADFCVVSAKLRPLPCGTNIFAGV